MLHARIHSIGYIYNFMWKGRKGLSTLNKKLTFEIFASFNRLRLTYTYIWMDRTINIVFDDNTISNEFSLCIEEIIKNYPIWYFPFIIRLFRIFPERCRTAIARQFILFFLIDHFNLIKLIFINISNFI